jgi:hypothetical protein
MSKLRALAALLALACVAVLAQAAVAAAPSVTPSFSLPGGPIACDGSVTATLTLDATNPAPTQQAADVVLLLDGSGSIGLPNFNNQVKSAAQSFVTGASPSPAGNHVGVIEFSTSVVQVAPLSDNPAALTSAITGMAYLAQNTATDAGLQAAETMLAGGRPGVPKVVVVMTDGAYNIGANPAIRAAAMRAAGTRIFAVGVGSGIVTARLLDLAGTADNVFQIANFDDLEATFQEILTVLTPAGQDLAYHVTVAPDWTLSAPTASAGLVAPAPGGFDWTLAKLDATTPTQVTISYTLTHTGATGGLLQPQQVAHLQWTDGSAGLQQADFDAAATQVDCNLPPVANAGPDQHVALSGSPTAHVALDGTASTDDGLLGPLAYSWSEGGSPLATGAAPTIDLGLGTHELTLTVGDGQYTASDTVTVDVYDPTPPLIVPAVAGTLGTNGWYTSDVLVTFAVSDPESAFTTTGCVATTVDADTTGTTVPCSATSAGGTATADVSVERDATAPTIAFAGNAGTYGILDTITITCTADDATSGIATTTCPAVASGPALSFPTGTNTFTASATDNAGNAGSATTSFTIVVTAADLCTLVGQYVTGPGEAGVENSLCVKISKGNTRPFENEVNAQRGKRLTSAQADQLIYLAKLL